MSRKNALLDTDIVMKIGGFTEEILLSKILLSYQSNLFIHEYLIKEELVINKQAIDQLNNMISSGEVTILEECDLNDKELFEYESALKILASEMDVDLRKRRCKNAGEVKSMAMAFAKDFEYFISDDRAARVAAKKHLQKLDGTYLTTIRMQDIIKHIKINQETLHISRKTARKLYLYGVNPKMALNAAEKEKAEYIRSYLKKDFDQTLWPVDK
jgi:predicted nucleic acid-binding protein